MCTLGTLHSSRGMFQVTRKFMAATLVSDALQMTVEVQSSFRTEKLRFMKS